MLDLFLLIVYIIDLDSIVNNKFIMFVKGIKLQGEIVWNSRNLEENVGFIQNYPDNFKSRK